MRLHIVRHNGRQQILKRIRRSGNGEFLIGQLARRIIADNAALLDDGLCQFVDLPASIGQLNLLFGVAHEQHDGKRVLKPLDMPADRRLRHRQRIRRFGKTIPFDNRDENLQLPDAEIDHGNPSKLLRIHHSKGSVA